MDYKVGDVINGHVLGADNQWHPVPVGAGTMPRRPLTYGQRYALRWRWSALAAAAVAVLLVVLHPGAEDLTSAIVRALGASVVNGSILNLVVAAFPERTHR